MGWCRLGPRCRSESNPGARSVRSGACRCLYHLETCFSEAVNEGRGREAIAELMDAVKFDNVLTGGGGSLAGAATGEATKARAR
jgi:hypothetical protein